MTRAEAIDTSSGSTAEREVSLEVDGGRIVGWMSGVGPPMLLLHGGPGLSDYLGQLAGELSSAFTVFRYQQRGLAPSVVEGDRSVEGHMADLLRVLDGLGWSKPWIAGHSWGGHLAMHFAVAHPDRIGVLVVIDPLGAVGDGGVEVFGENLLRQLPPALRARVEELDAAEQRGEQQPGDLVESLGILWPYYFANPADASPMPPMQGDHEGHLETWASVRAHFEAGTLEGGLPRLQLPAIFIHGAVDPIPADETERSAALVRGARLHVLEGIGHFPWLEKPGSIVGLLRGLAVPDQG
ncbi:MAG: alpha/beta hydrolase [Chloroflexi bacterium]|nr:MAG: alpha/beta hydrolase [Chloroflexota bacterium]